MFESAVEEIRKYGTIIIHRHKSPDGDAIGAQTGLKLILSAAFPEKKIYAVGDCNPRFSFLEGAEPDVIPDEAYENALSVILDTSQKAMIADERWSSARRSLRIDHHVYCERIAAVDLSDPSFESCSGMIAAFAGEAGWRIPKAAARALYTGMVTDTGRFRYGCTSPRTLRLAASLIETGQFDAASLYSSLYQQEFELMVLRAKFTLRISFTAHRVAYIYTSKEELEALGTDIRTASRGMVGTMADIRGSDLWVNFTEAPDGVYAELRSSKYNVNGIAAKYGGGGHPKASGATLKDRAEAMALLNDLDLLAADGEPERKTT